MACVLLQGVEGCQISSCSPFAGGGWSKYHAFKTSVEAIEGFVLIKYALSDEIFLTSLTLASITASMVPVQSSDEDIYTITSWNYESRLLCRSLTALICWQRENSFKLWKTLDLMPRSGIGEVGLNKTRWFILQDQQCLSNLDGLNIENGMFCRAA